MSGAVLKRSNITAERWKELGLPEFARRSPPIAAITAVTRPRSCSNGRHQMGEDHRLDRADEGNGAADAGGGGKGLCQQEPALAQAHGDLRQGIVMSLSLCPQTFFTLPTRER